MTTILVIEDEAHLREEILDLLEIQGFRVIDAKEGRTGLHLAQTQSPDLIICDIMLPELDGYSILTALRQNPETAIIPFIFLTAKESTDDFRQGLRLGADGYLIKPFRHTELLETIAVRLAKQTAVLQLHQHVKELQQSNLLKDNFLNQVSQELRAPLTNIMMAVQMLQKDPNHDRLQRYIEVLQAECARELNLLDDLLDLQRLRTNTRPFKIEVLRLQEWVPIIVEPFQSIAQEREQTIQVNIPPYIPAVYFDCADLKRILAELLKNACKYTSPGGKITVEVYRALVPPTTGDAEPAIILIVSNEAEIPSEAMPHLFEQFYRVPKGDRWQQGGSGLGLTLVQELIERTGGTIQVISGSGWTQFTVQFPSQTTTSLSNQEIS